jgi:hypothetical protein
MPKMVRVYIRSALIGVALSCCFVAALLALDVAHLRHLLLNSEVGWLAVIMMIVFNMIVFSGVQFAFTVMSQAETPPSSDRGSRVVAFRDPTPATVAAPKTHRK